MRFVRKDGYVDLVVKNVRFSTVTVERDEFGLIEVVVQITHPDGFQEPCYFQDILEGQTVEELVFMIAESFDFEEQVAA